MREALEPAARDIEVATSNAAAGYYEWSACTAQQAAVKAVRALMGPDSMNESEVESLLERAASWLLIPDAVRTAARELDRAVRDFAAGAADRFSETRSRELIGRARIVLEFCRSQIGEVVSR